MQNLWKKKGWATMNHGVLGLVHEHMLVEEGVVVEDVEVVDSAVVHFVFAR